MSAEEVMEKVVKISCSTHADVATITTEIVQSSTQQLNTESITIELK